MNHSNEFRSKLLNEDLFHSSTVNYVENIKDANPVVIWGTGSAGQTVFRFLERFGISQNVKYFADNHKQKWGTKRNGLMVLSAEEAVKLTKENPKALLIISSQHLADIKNQLLSLGVEDKVIDTKGFYLAKNYWIFQEETAYQMIDAHFVDFKKVYDCLSDERSKEVYLGILNSKIALDNKYLDGIASRAEEQYFDKELIKLSENEVFCDCGSFNGDTLESFVSLTNGNYQKYIAIEADPGNFAELNKKIKKNGYNQVQTHHLACWNETTVLNFHPASTAGHVTKAGNISVQADALDNILKEERVTFLKMDIEGAEEMALKGACKVIWENKPILAICLYHSLKDFYKLPLLMKGLNQDYRLFIRHYTDLVDVETVCYAIPNERLK